MYRIWPEETAFYKAQVGIQKNSLLPMEPERKLALEGLLARVGKRETTAKGVLTMLQVAPREKMMRITGPDGQITSEYPKNIEETAKRLVGKPVIVYGDATFDAEGNVKEFVNIDQIKEFNETVLHRIISEKQEFTLREPLVVSVAFQDAWILKNEELGIMVASKDYDDCIKQFYEEFAFIWNEYGNASDEELTEDAKALKQRILQCVKKA